MKDIFIDCNIAKNFANPMDSHYKDLLKWIMEYDEKKATVNIVNKNNYAHLVVNQKLLIEYNRTSYNCAHSTSITSIINLLTRQGRLIKMHNKDIEEYKSKHFKKATLKKLLSNEEDHCHICSILNSTRKLVLTYDKNLKKDLLSFIKMSVLVSDRPEKIKYK